MRVLKRCTNFIPLLPIALLALLFFLTLQHIAFWLQNGRRLASILSVEATRSLHRRIVVQNVLFRHSPWSLRPNEVILKNVSVGPDPHSRQPAPGSVQSIAVQYSPQLFFGSRRLQPPISQITLKNPHLSLARNSRGIWNFASLLHPSHIGNLA